MFAGLDTGQMGSLPKPCPAKRCRAWKCLEAENVSGLAEPSWLELVELEQRSAQRRACAPRPY